MAGLFGGNFDPSQIADLIANLPPDMKAGIVGALANKYPAAAVNLAESIADATENKVRAERKARGAAEDDEEEEEEEEDGDDDDGDDDDGDEEGDDEEEEDEEDLDDLFDDGDDGDDGDDEEE